MTYATHLTEADTNLIEAAPQLLDSMLEILPMVENWLQDREASARKMKNQREAEQQLEMIDLWRRGQIARAKTAIAKAKGE